MCGSKLCPKSYCTGGRVRLSVPIFCLWGRALPVTHLHLPTETTALYSMTSPSSHFFRDGNWKSCNFYFKNQAKRPPPAHRSLVPTRSGNRLAMHPNKHTPIDKHLFHQKVIKGDSKKSYLLYNITTAATTITKSSWSCQWLMHPFPFHLIKKKKKNKKQS